MPATHRAISHKFSEPCKHNIYLSATLSRLLYVAIRNPRRRGAAASDLYLTPTATARDPGWERGLVKQIMKEREGGEKKSKPNSNHPIHPHALGDYIWQLFPSSWYTLKWKRMLTMWTFLCSTESVQMKGSNDMLFNGSVSVHPCWHHGWNEREYWTLEPAMSVCCWRWVSIIEYVQVGAKSEFDKAICTIHKMHHKRWYCKVCCVVG